MTALAMTLYTVQEVARLLHVSDDTVRRQIREGDLEAVQIGTTPKGRPRYRIPGAVVERQLSRQAVAQPSALEQFRTLFERLTDAEREEVLQQAIQWARTTQPEPAELLRSAALNRDAIAQRLSPGARALLAQTDEE